MTGRTHFVLITTLSGGTAVATTVIAIEQWRARWPLDVTWAGVTILLVWPLVIGYLALWRPAPRERLERACMHLFAAVYLAITSAMLLLLQLMLRTR